MVDSVIPSGAKAISENSIPFCAKGKTQIPRCARDDNFGGMTAFEQDDSFEGMTGLKGMTALNGIITFERDDGIDDSFDKNVCSEITAWLNR